VGMNDKKNGKRTALYELHVAAGAKMIDFGGWEMPVQYEGIISEHNSVRESAGAFDVSHMGRLSVSGGNAEAFLQYVATNDVARLEIGQAQYSLLCNREGGVKDDVLIYRLADERFLVVVNASNREAVLSWFDEVRKELAQKRGRPLDLGVDDRTLETVMIGVQGPGAMELLQPLTAVSLEQLKYYRAQSGEVAGGEALVSRTGYTGEDGFEVILEAEAGRQLWERLSDQRASGTLALAGLGARDTLRLEAGMPLYGHELTEQINPIEVGLSRVVRLDKGDFVGREALAAVAADGPARRLVGLVVEDGAMARQGTAVEVDGAQVGEVTSGSFSPTLGASIAMALVESSVPADAPLQVVVRGQPHPCRVADLPFFHRRRRAQR
jgi:aminomethyltransferase